MPAKKKLQTIFKTNDDFEKYVKASIADCATIGVVMEQAGNRATQEIVDAALEMAYSRFKLIMGEYGRRFKNGDIKDILEELTDEDFTSYQEDCMKFADKVLEGRADAKESKQPEVSNQTDTDDAQAH